jgi:hypothetical protein
MNIDFAIALFAFAVGAVAVGLWARTRSASREVTAEAKGRQAADLELIILWSLVQVQHGLPIPTT